MLDAADAGGEGQPSNGRDLVDLELEFDLDLDLDLDLDAAYWQQLVSSPPPPFLVSPYPPLPPFWLFEDRSVESSSSLADLPMIVHCNSDTTNENITRDEGRMLRMPVENFKSSYVIKEKISKALRYFKESTDQHILVQLWAPVKTGDRYVLTTSGQPFALDPQSTRLLHYRTVSLPYMFSLDEDSDGHLGLPGRVFKQKYPEWTPNVQYYSSTEYARLGHALQYDVQGSLALPVFEPSSESCVGVVEIILTSPKIHYGTEIDKVCKALEAVDLRTSEILDHPNVQICNEGRQAALGEILEILTVVCEALKLPLAQTWVPCMHHCVVAHGDDFKKSCMSTTDMAFYVVDPRMWGFRDACVEHHLQRGQGVTGRAFESRRPRFCGDITQFGKAEYPLVHYARMFGLAGCLVICLQSTQTGDDEYILEFFLPPECKDASGQKAFLDSITTMINHCFQGLKTVRGLGFKGGLSPETFYVLADESHVGEPKLLCDESYETHRRTSSETYICDRNNGSQDVGSAIPESQEQHLVDDDGDTVDGSGPSSPVLGNKSSEILQRRRGKAEKSISLEVLQRYFCGSLKDAAKSLGVCPTTMKRICRQHGITRWPSRKISKVNRSLSKLKRVIESVHGAEGAFNLTSFACPIPAANCSTYPLPLTSDVSTHKEVISRGKKSALKVTNREPKGSDCSKSVSSSNGSLDTPPQGSNQPSPVQEQRFVNYPFSPDICGLDKPVMSSVPESITLEDPVPLLHGMLVEDSGSSKDLRNLYNSVGEPELLQSERLQEPRAVTIKACYKEDIIRFRLPCVHACMVLLNDEVAKRLKLEVGTFTVKYLDDDRELVMLACDGDLEECIELAGSSGAQVIRLTVHDVSTNLVSSCGSS